MLDSQCTILTDRERFVGVLPECGVETAVSAAGLGGGGGGGESS